MFYFRFYLFITEKNANQCMYNYFSIKRRSASKIWKIQFSILKLNTRMLIKYIVTAVVGLISWWPEWLFWGFKYSHFCSGSPAELVRIHRPPLWTLFFISVHLLFFDSCRTTSLYNCFLEVSLGDILSQLLNNAYIYT